MRTIRTVLGAVLEKHAGAVRPDILGSLRIVYGELAGVVSKDQLKRLRMTIHNEVAVANMHGYSDFVADTVCVDDAFLEELS
jgi:hypothetical protein